MHHFFMDCNTIHRLQSQVLSRMASLKIWRWITKRSFTEVSRLYSFFPCRDASTPLKQKFNLEVCKILWNSSSNENPDARDRMMNMRTIEILTNDCFSALYHAERLMIVEQSIKSKASQTITSENEAVVMLDYQKQIQCIWHANSRANFWNLS